MVFSLMGDVRCVFFGVDLLSQKRDQFSSPLVVAGVVLVGMQLVDVRWSSRKYQRGSSCMGSGFTHCE